MAGSVIVKFIGDPEKATQLQVLLANHFKNLKGNWTAELLGDQKNTIWELKIDDPDGNRSGVKKFYGEDGEHSLEAIARYLNFITLDVPKASAAQ